MILKRALIIAMVLLVAAQVVRNSAVDALADLHPEQAAMLWRGHPAVEISEAMREIAEASRQRKPVADSAFALMDNAALKSPLSPEPFLVRGVQTAIAGDKAAAGRYFIQAQRREPRSMAAAYFLSDYYFRSGHVLAGLEQATLLARLSPAGTRAVAPFVAVYAQNPSNWQQIRALFRVDERLQDHVLLELARDPRNTRTVLALADPPHRNAQSPWLRPLVQNLVSAREYALAQQTWTFVSNARAQPGALVYDSDFSDPVAPPPFNWSLSSSILGIAEREAGRGLHVIYYGENEGVLASELLLLPPGTYRFGVQVGGESAQAESLHWSVRCAGQTTPFSSIPLDIAAKRGWTFDVPRGCPAQWLELSGQPADIVRQADVILKSVGISKVNGGA